MRPWPKQFFLHDSVFPPHLVTKVHEFIQILTVAIRVVPIIPFPPEIKHLFISDDPLAKTFLSNIHYINSQRLVWHLFQLNVDIAVDETRSDSLKLSPYLSPNADVGNLI